MSLKLEQIILIFLSGLFVVGIILKLTVRDSVRIEKRLIDINQASRAELDILPGIGPKIAGRIIAYRDSCGGLDSLDQLVDIKGISKRGAEKLRPFVKPLKGE